MSERAESTDTPFWTATSGADALHRYRTPVKPIDDGIYQLDADGRSVAVNDVLVEITGYARGELVGGPVAMLFDDGEGQLHVTADGVEALEFLHQRGEFPDAPRPDIVLLDLNLPRKGGEELLTDIRDHPVLETIPVIIRPSSEARADVVRSYEQRANAYLTTPVDPGEFIDVIEAIQEFWLSVARLPSKTRS